MVHGNECSPSSLKRCSAAAQTPLSVVVSTHPESLSPVLLIYIMVCCHALGMRIRPSIYYCLFSLIANICLSLNNQQSVVLSYFSSLVPEKVEMALRGFWVSVIRRALFVTVTGQAPSDLVWWVKSQGKSLIGMLETESYSLPTICALGCFITSTGHCREV